MWKWISLAVIGAALYATNAHPIAVGIYTACLTVTVALEIMDRRQATA